MDTFLALPLPVQIIFAIGGVLGFLIIMFVVFVDFEYTTYGRSKMRITRVDSEISIIVGEKRILIITVDDLDLESVNDLIGNEPVKLEYNKETNTFVLHTR